MSTIAIQSGQNRYDNVIRVLNLLNEEIGESIKDKKRIVIKPNLCVPDNDLAVTHVEAVKALLDYLSRIINIEDIIIAGAPFKGNLEEGLKNYGYLDKLKTYPIKYIDLNEDDTSKVEVKDHKGNFIKFNIAKILLDSDYIISICPPKTHDTVITTLTLKNVVVGGIINKLTMSTMHRNWRTGIHGSYKKTNYLMFELAKIFKPTLCIIDGKKGMEGCGPTSNCPVDFNIALTSLDFVAIDTITSYLMGFEPKDIGYLKYCHENGLGQGDLEKIKVIGVDDYKKHKIKFKPHDTYLEQLKWWKH